METQEIKLSKNPIGYQIFLPIIGVIAIGILIMSIVINTLRPILATLVGLFFMSKMWPYLKTKLVVYTNNSIIVSSLYKKETIPVDNIEEILILGKGIGRVIQIVLKINSYNFGKIITFIPNKEISIPTDKTKGINLAPGMWIRKY